MLTSIEWLPSTWYFLPKQLVICDLPLTKRHESLSHPVNTARDVAVVVLIPRGLAGA